MRKILSILTVTWMALALASCSSRPKGAEVVISQFLDKVKALEISKESLSPYIYNYNDQLETFNRMASGPGFSESKSFFNIYFGHLEYKFKEHKTSPDGTLVATEVRNVGSSSFTQRLMDEVLNKYLQYSLASMEKLNNANEEEKEKIMKDSENYLNDLLKKFKIKDSDFLTNEVTFLVKKDDKGVDKIVLKDQEEGDRLVAALMPRPEEETDASQLIVEEGKAGNKGDLQEAGEVLLETTSSNKEKQSECDCNKK